MASTTTGTSAVVAVGRALIGVVTVVAPKTSGRLLYSDAEQALLSRPLLRMFGVREIVLAYGTLATLRPPSPSLRSWQARQAWQAWQARQAWTMLTTLCDAGDVLALLGDRDHTLRPAARVLAGTAAAGAVLHTVTSNDRRDLSGRGEHRWHAR